MAKTEADAGVIDVPAVEVIDELDISQWYRGKGEPEVLDPLEVQREIVAAILSATTIEGILKPVTTTVAEDILGQTLFIRGYRRMPSTKADSALKFYLLIDCVDAHGEVLNVTCGSVNVMARLFALNANNFLPLYGALVQSGKMTASGYYPMDLEGRTAEDAEKEAKEKGKDF